jgi:hypothetical protein
LANLTVNPVKPRATLQTSSQVETVQNANLNLWVVELGDTLRLTNLEFPSEWEKSGVKYHFRVCTGPLDPGVPNTGEDQALDVPDYAFDDYTPGKVYEVEGWVTDRAGEESVHQSFTVVVGDAIPWGPTTSFGPSGSYVNWSSSPRAHGVVTVNDDTPPANAIVAKYTNYAREDYPANAPFTVRVSLNPATVAYAQREHFDIVYGYNFSEFDVSPDLFGTRTVRCSRRSSTTARRLPSASRRPRLTGRHRGQRRPQRHRDHPGVLDSVLQQREGRAGRRGDRLRQRVGRRRVSAEGVLVAVRRASLGNVNWNDANSVTARLLSSAGLTWDKVYQVVREELGEGNLTALEKVFGDPTSTPRSWAGSTGPTRPTRAPSSPS